MLELLLSTEHLSLCILAQALRLRVHGVLGRRQQRDSRRLQIILNKSCTLPALFPDSWCERTPRWPEGQLHLAKKKPLKDHLRNLQVLVRTSLSVPCAEVVASPETCRKEKRISLAEAVSCRQKALLGSRLPALPLLVQTIAEYCSSSFLSQCTTWATAVFLGF